MKSVAQPGAHLPRCFSSCCRCPHIIRISARLCCSLLRSGKRLLLLLEPILHIMMWPLQLASQTATRDGMCEGCDQ